MYGGMDGALFHLFPLYPQIAVSDLSRALLATAVIKICHCLHLQDLENSMKMWECKHSEIQAASQPQLDSQESQDSLSDEEYAQMQRLVQLAENLISR